MKMKENILLQLQLGPLGQDFFEKTNCHHQLEGVLTAASTSQLESVGRVPSQFKLSQ